MDELPLYWTDPGLMECTATVTSAEPADGGWKLVLDRQLFYPGGGGQRADRGTIDDIPLLGINKINNEIHLSIGSGGKYAPGDKVECAMDAPFRRDSRQQHSGQHLLSSALSEEGLETLSVHLGTDYTGIEVDANSDELISESRIEKVLQTCDLWINEGRRIKSLYLKPEELAGLDLRRSLSDKTDMNGNGPVRIIEVEGVDRVGCGGVHLDSTSSIGLILFTGLEKMHGHIRLHFLIGDPAVERARHLSRRQQTIQKLLSVGPEEIGSRITALLDENRIKRKAVMDMEKEIGGLLAGGWIASGNGVIARKVKGSRERMEGALDILKKSEIPMAFLISGIGESSENSWLLFNHITAVVEFEKFKSEILEPFNGSGGGKPGLWRGRIHGNPEEILGIVKDWLELQG